MPPKSGRGKKVVKPADVGVVAEANGSVELPKSAASKAKHTIEDSVEIPANEENCEENGGDEGQKTEKPVAKRGRKAKKQESSEVLEDQSKEEEDTEAKKVVKGKPGRSKTKEETPEEVPELEKKETEPSDKRGPKKGKTHNEEDKNHIEESVIDSTSEDVPKPAAGKRGRPKKTTEEVPEPAEKPKSRKPVAAKEEASPLKSSKRKANESAKTAGKKGKMEPVLQKELRVELVRLEEEELAGEKPKESAPKKGKRAAKNEKVDEEKKASESGKGDASGPTTGKKLKIDVGGLDFDNESTTADGKKWNFKISSWNINGVRAWLEKDGMSYLQSEAPDVMCIQETKCADDKLPTEAKKVNGYHCYWLAGDKQGYSGVGLLSKKEPLSVSYGIDIKEHDSEGRVVTAEYDKFFLVNAYVPNAGRGLVRLEYRQKWDADFRAYLLALKEKKPVILCGDLNVAHKEIDLANPSSNKKNAGFTVEERDGFSALLSEGYVDSFRHFYPQQKAAYSFWTYMANARTKNVGWRIDYFVVSEKFMDNVTDSAIRKDVLGSDHCPITLFLAI